MISEHSRIFSSLTWWCLTNSCFVHPRAKMGDNRPGWAAARPSGDAPAQYSSSCFTGTHYWRRQRANRQMRLKWSKSNPLCLSMLGHQEVGILWLFGLMSLYKYSNKINIWSIIKFEPINFKYYNLFGHFHYYRISLENEEEIDFE